MKPIICSICGKEVSHRQSYSIGDGKRACQVHKEAKEFRDKQQATENQRLLKEEKPNPPQSQQKETHWIKNDKPSCWVCGKSGVSARDFFFSKVVEMEKMKLRGEPFPNLFTKEGIDKFRATEPVIFVVDFSKWDNATRRKLVQVLKPYMVAPACFGEVVSICGDCIGKHQFPNPLPKVDLDKAMLIGAAMRPIVEKVAKKEMWQDDIKGIPGG